MNDISNTAETPETAAPETPEWFDAEAHVIREGGIFEAATGVLLGEDGEPFSLAVRLMRADAAAAKAATDDAPAKPSKKPRGTEKVLADHINPGADAGEQE